MQTTNQNITPEQIQQLNDLASIPIVGIRTEVLHTIDQKEFKRIIEPVYNWMTKFRVVNDISNTEFVLYIFRDGSSTKNEIVVEIRPRSFNHPLKIVIPRYIRNIQISYEMLYREQTEITFVASKSLMEINNWAPILIELAGKQKITPNIDIYKIIEVYIDEQLNNIQLTVNRQFIPDKNLDNIKILANRINKTLNKRIDLIDTLTIIELHLEIIGTPLSRGNEQEIMHNIWELYGTEFIESTKEEYIKSIRDYKNKLNFIIKTFRHFIKYLLQ